MTDKVKSALQELADIWACDVSEVKDGKRTLRTMFELVEKHDGVQVFWGCWTDEELDEIPC